MERELHEKNVRQINELYLLLAKDENNFEKLGKEIEEINNLYINEFLLYLNEQNVPVEEINDHVVNVGFYINQYLIALGEYNIYNGMHGYNDFFSYFFVQKCGCRNKEDILEFVTSLKKFYRFMYSKEYILQIDIDKSERTIIKYKDKWLSIVDNYEYGKEEAEFDVPFDDPVE